MFNLCSRLFMRKHCHLTHWSPKLYSTIPKLNSKQFQYAALKHRNIIEVSGADALPFLQGLITNDITLISEMKCMYCMVLNQHGRVLNDLIIYNHFEDQGGVLLECESELAESFMKTLRLYKLRKKVNMALKSDVAVLQEFQTEPHGLNHMQPESSPPIQSQNSKTIATFTDPRLPSMGNRLLIANVSQEDWPELCDVNEYHHTRHRLGIPEGAIDLPPTKCLPLECNLDYMNGVSFHKGCYVGQELTARTKFTGVIRKRLVPVEISGDGLIESETSLYTAKGKNAGKFRSCISDRVGLALVRLNYVNETLSTKSGHELKCYIPWWWPSKDGKEFSDGVCGPVAE